MDKLLRMLVLIPAMLVCVIAGVGAQVPSGQVHSEAFNANDTIDEFIYIQFAKDVTKVDISYRDNQTQLSRLDSILRNVGLENILSLTAVSLSSPEGKFEYNTLLSNGRSKSTVNYLKSAYPELGSVINARPDGESWKELRQLVENDTVLDSTAIAKVLAVLDANVHVDTRKWRMEHSLGDGVYSYLYETYYPRIRYSGINIEFLGNGNGTITPQLDEPLGPVVVTDEALPVSDTAIPEIMTIPADTLKSQIQPVELDTAAVESAVDTLVSVFEDSVPDLADSVLLTSLIRYDETVELSERPYSMHIGEPNLSMFPLDIDTSFRFVQLEVPTLREPALSVKTNLLYDMFFYPGMGYEPILNVEAEYYPKGSRRWTFLAEYEFPWWSKDSEYEYFQLLNLQLEARRYFNSDGRFLGHYVSAYTHAFLYDFCMGNPTGTGYQGEGIGLGVGYGYVMPLGKSERWKLELFAKWGYFLSGFDKYDAGNPYKGRYYYHYYDDPERFIKRNNRFSWFFPTGAGVTLSYDLIYRNRK